jgi:hypothetical protein
VGVRIRRRIPSAQGVVSRWFSPTLV